ncbi:amidophosphoribosyltransferase [Metallosphaera sedula]|uniref:Amidophosphoribosyltransferase n=3 Tax=Metallosphaera TaxID=41980 RepID=A4YI70_METS5|nr:MULTISPECIES: amidophosphoribosyltransferase [Metallosphaera]ABP96122.1 amidophosphoribosyltransferase [Metallosphaera sedula DSM 5348]AIM28105.1 amidophosphoribosyltransferase [Metallosphaera sedula]AKV74931.1 amidophosphoribosyltransferase [Metallosphaera sedula]AKV77169.1 amidophosphoribosyltransferase [Metallosphaera sedula]AKV79419.1 amidophosphoribosyltransferase [Metallosphaera sedula]
MAGIVGLLAFDKVWNVSKFLYYSMVGLQHRGYASSGVVMLNQDMRSVVKDVSPEDLEFQLEGWAGIGYTGSRRGYPIHNDEVAIAVDGVLRDPESFLKAFTKDREKALEEARGAFSLVAMTRDGEIVGYRDETGVRPLSLGGFGFDMGIIASEPVAMSVIGGDFRREIQPGEMVTISSLNVKSRQIKEPRKAYCSIEYVYQARIDSQVNENSVYETRVRIGEQLAEEKPIKADTVIGVPDTALPFAVGYSRKLGLQLDLGFTRTGSPIRTMLASDSFLKIVGVQLKLNPIKGAVFGKRVVLIDDSMVTGTTLKNTIMSLRRLGAKEVHVLIGSPKLISACPYGIEVPEDKELIAANLSEEEIAKVLGADSIHWLSLEGLFKAISRSTLCTGCMTKKYPKVI